VIAARQPDPQERELRDLAKTHRVRVKVDARARRNGAPHVVLLLPSRRELARFRSPVSAIRWLEGTTREARE
jgi:hypothetical protein